MKERPILFSGEMVRAILQGRKTQTRRIIKPPIEHRANVMLQDVHYGIIFVCDGKHDKHAGCEYRAWTKCPYGMPSDRLWVRETWGESGLNRVEYKAFPADGKDFRCVSRWRPSIHMPRWASRITLEITNIRAERVLDISEEDAIAEGLDSDSFPDPVVCFGLLWDKLNFERGFSFHSNPWVWVIEFRRVPSD